MPLFSIGKILFCKLRDFSFTICLLLAISASDALADNAQIQIEFLSSNKGLLKDTTKIHRQLRQAFSDKINIRVNTELLTNKNQVEQVVANSTGSSHFFVHMEKSLDKIDVDFINHGFLHQNAETALKKSTKGYSFHYIEFLFEPTNEPMALSESIYRDVVSFVLVYALSHKLFIAGSQQTHETTLKKLLEYKIFEETDNVRGFRIMQSEIYYELGEFEYQRGNFVEAKNHYLAATKFYMNSNAYLKLSLIEEKSNNLKESYRYIETVLEHNLPATYAELGNLYVARRQYLIARGFLERSATLYEEYEKQIVRYEQLWLKLKNIEKLHRKFKDVDYDEQIEQLYFVLAQLSLLEKQFNTAETWANSLLKRNPDSAKGHIVLAQSYEIQKKFAKAEPHYLEAVRKSPTYQVYTQIGYFYIAWEKYSNAEHAFSSAINLDKNNPEGYFNLALTYGFQKNRKLEEEYYKKSLLIDPEYADAHNNLGYFYYLKGEYQQALLEITYALRIKPHMPEALYNLGLIYWRQNKNKKAQQSMVVAFYENPQMIDDDPNVTDRAIAYAVLYSYYQEFGYGKKAEKTLDTLKQLLKSADKTISKKVRQRIAEQIVKTK